MSTPFVDPENPESQGPTVPTFYTNACQVRQYGVGGASTHGAGPSVLGALANPPAAMVTAAGAAINAPVTTINDLEDYHTVADANTAGANGDGVTGGTP